jgi:hypothetical protein
MFLIRADTFSPYDFFFWGGGALITLSFLCVVKKEQEDTG